MAIAYLKVSADDAYQILDDLALVGSQLRDQIVTEYLPFSSTPDAVEVSLIRGWQEKANLWADSAIQKMQVVFVSSTPLYEFRDAQPPFGATSANIHYFSIISLIKARVDKLIEFRNNIRDKFDVHFEVVLGNKIEQIGSNNSATVTN